MDNIYNVNEKLEISMVDIFSRFTELYWNLKHHLQQMRQGRAANSAIFNLIEAIKTDNFVVDELPFERLNQFEKEKLVFGAVKDCSRYVVGALYVDFKYIIYGFDKQKIKI